MRRRALGWGDRLLFGVFQALELNKSWLFVYVLVVSIVAVLRQLFLGDFVWQGVLLFVVGDLVLAIAVYKGGVLYKRSPTRVFNRVLVVAATVFGSVLVVAASALLPLDRDGVLLRAFVGGFVAITTATIVVFIVIVFGGTAFNRDFASPKMFAEVSFGLHLVIGAFVLYFSSQNLLYWPPNSAGAGFRSPATVDELLRLMVDSPNGRVLQNEMVLGIIATALGGISLVLVVFWIYWLVAQRFWRQNPTNNLLVETPGLLKRNLANRLWGGGSPVWPSATRDPQHARNIDNQPELNDFALTLSLPAISLAFGFWAPLVISESWCVAFLPLAIVVVYVVANIDVWFQAIDIAGDKGTGYTFGFWLGVIVVYLPVAVLPSLVMDVAFRIVGSSEVRIVFEPMYRLVLATSAILIAFSQPGNYRSTTSTRAARDTIALTASLVVIGLGIHAVEAPGLQSLFGGVETDWHVVAEIARAGLSVLTATIIAFAPIARLRTSRNPLETQLVVSSSLALAPLLFGQRLDGEFEWSDNGFVDLVVKNTGLSSHSLRLRTYVVQSEDEVAFETLSPFRRLQHGPMDFVITDLQSAIGILGAWKNTRDYQKGYSYKILAVVGDISWRHFEIVQPVARSESDDEIFLDPGFIRYAPRYQPSLPATHPLNCNIAATDLCRIAGFPTVAKYTLDEQAGISQAVLPEPYASWLVRRVRAKEGWRCRSIADSRVTYVLLARHKKEGHPATAFNWRRAIFEAICEGRDQLESGSNILNHERLQVLHEFIQRATAYRIDLGLADLHIGLCRGDFGHMFPRGARDDDGLIANDLFKNRLVTRKELSALTGEDDSRAARYPLGTSKEALTEGSLNEVERSRSLTQVLTSDELDLSDNHFLMEQQRRVSEPGDFEKFSFPLTAVLVPDYPGELSKVLAVIQDARVDLSMVASVNLGETSLVYFVSRRSLIDGVAVPCNGAPMEFTENATSRRSLTETWLRVLQKSGYEYVTSEAVVIPIIDEVGSLHELVSGIHTRTGVRVNIEGIMAFPWSDNKALAFVQVRGRDRRTLLGSLAGVNQPNSPEVDAVGSTSESVAPIPRFTGLTLRQHQQHVVFPEKVDIALDLRFDCDLPTDTFTWGGVRNWIAERDFHEVRLMVPTELRFRMAILGSLRLPSLFRRELLKRISGVAGLATYSQGKNWHMEKTDPQSVQRHQ